VVGNKVLVGAVGYDALKAAIAEARAAKAAR
jgi:protein-disulfide isomerase